jgi:hypothetical protein
MTTTPSTEEVATTKYQVALKGDTKAPMLLNVEVGIKEVASALAKKEKIAGIDIDAEAYAHLPNSLTGVLMHLVVAGLKAELDIAFDETPKSMKQRGNNAMDKKVAGKKRLLTREEKNEILEKTQMSFYEPSMSVGTITIEDAMASIREAFNKKKEFEDMGYMLPAGKTKYPYWVEEEEKKD